MAKYTHIKNQTPGTLHLQNIPDKWEIVPVWMLFELGRGRVISHDEIWNNRGPYPVYSSQTVDDGVMGYLNTFDFDGDYLTWTTDGANAGTVFHRRGKFNCTNVCGTLLPQHEYVKDLRFFKYALDIATDQFVRHDINPKLMNDVMAQIEIQTPLHHEQKLIANYLDKETAKIDKLISALERLLDLLAEKRLALITYAVTRGLDPNVKLRDSGVEWIGEIPSHWRVLRFRTVVDDIEGGFTPQSYNYPAEKDEWGVLKTGCVNGGVFNPNENKALPQAMMIPENLKIERNDILMSRASGSLELIGSVAMIESEPPARLLLSDKTFRLHLNAQLIAHRFFVQVMGSSAIRHQIRMFVSGAAGLANNISQTDIREIILPIPSLDEQIEISSEIATQTSKIDKLSNVVTVLVNALFERRVSLISAAVTGQLDIPT